MECLTSKYAAMKLLSFYIHIKNIASMILRNGSASLAAQSVWVEFDWGTDIYLARQIVSEKLAEVQHDLPRLGAGAHGQAGRAVQGLRPRHQGEAVG